MVSHTFPGIAPVQLATVEFDARLQKFVDSKGYSAVTGGQSPAVAGQFVTMRLRNPSTSLKNVFLEGVWASSNVNNRLRMDTFQNPALADLATSITVRPKRRGQAAGSATASFAANVAAQVGNTAFEVFLIANDHRFIPIGLILTPDTSLDLQFFTTITTDVDELTAEWYEE